MPFSPIQDRESSRLENASKILLLVIDYCYRNSSYSRDSAKALIAQAAKHNRPIVILL